MEKNGHSSNGEFTEKIIQAVSPIIKKSIADAGLSYLEETHGYNGTEIKRVDKPEDVLKLPDSDFVGDFFVAKTFSPQEMYERLKNRRDYEELQPFIPKEPLEVRLVLGVNADPFPMLINPIDTKPESGAGSFKRTRTLDMLAGKIVRSITDKYKPTDLIDIYNLIKGRYISNGNPLKNLDPSSPDNRLDTLRTLIMAYMPMSRGVWPENNNLLSTFQDTPENKRRFLERVEPEIAANKMPALREKVDDIFATINQLLVNVTGPSKQNTCGPLNLTKNEKAFFDGIDGYREEQEIPSAKPAKGMFALLSKNRKTTHETTVRIRIEPQINVELLKHEHPEAFKKYPELATNIGHNPILESKVMERKHSAGTDTGSIEMDF
ncbi:MAG: hypothetical protein KGI29_02190, partial [Pseudomonadota bacterium]|nr:hypothetical protein [Pseudomonadota bacterium]